MITSYVRMRLEADLREAGVQPFDYRITHREVCLTVDGMKTLLAGKRERAEQSDGSRLTAQQFADKLVEYGEKYRSRPFASWQEAVREMVRVAFEDGRYDAMRVLGVTNEQNADSVTYTLEGECDRYGLPHDFDALMRHVYANRDLVRALDQETIRLLTERLEQNADSVRQRASAAVIAECEFCDECGCPLPGAPR